MGQTSIALRALTALMLAAWLSPGNVQAQAPLPPNGPYNGVFRSGGPGLNKPADPKDTAFEATSPWSLYCWFQDWKVGSASTLLAGVGDPSEEYSRYLGV